MPRPSYIDDPRYRALWAELLSNQENKAGPVGGIAIGLQKALAGYQAGKIKKEVEADSEDYDRKQQQFMRSLAGASNQQLAQLLNGGGGENYNTAAQEMNAGVKSPEQEQAQRVGNILSGPPGGEVDAEGFPVVTPRQTPMLTKQGEGLAGARPLTPMEALSNVGSNSRGERAFAGDMFAPVLQATMAEQAAERQARTTATTDAAKYAREQKGREDLVRLRESLRKGEAPKPLNLLDPSGKVRGIMSNDPSLPELLNSGYSLTGEQDPNADRDFALREQQVLNGRQTEAIRNATAMGLKPGTTEFNEVIRKSMERGPLVQVGASGQDTPMPPLPPAPPDASGAYGGAGVLNWLGNKGAGAIGLEWNPESQEAANYADSLNVKTQEVLQRVRPSVYSQKVVLGLLPSPNSLFTGLPEAKVKTQRLIELFDREILEAEKAKQSATPAQVTPIQQRIDSMKTLKDEYSNLLGSMSEQPAGSIGGISPEERQRIRNSILGATGGR